MKITWNWLGEYVDLSGLTPGQVAADLTSAGIPVEWMEPMASGVEGVVIGHVLSTEPHPNADRLRVCKVDAGTGESLNIVCGAANVAAGQRVPVAMIGARLPGIKIGKSKLRGVESEGMICSVAELGLDVKMMPKEQTAGIYVLPADAPIGTSIVDYLGLSDMVMELELTPNRSDCLSLRGVAYEVAAFYGRAVTMPDAPVLSPAGGETFPLEVRLETDLCSAYSAQVVAGLKLGPSPSWMQMRLLAIGTRPINNLVDITNYVMYEWGQPLHAFDYGAIHRRSIIVRQAYDQEEIVTLDGQNRVLPGGAVVIADPDRAVAVAGVMGGENSEVTGETQAVVIESAIFDPLQTRRTAKHLQLRSEASLRFEKGIDPVVTQLALARAAALMTQYAGGAIASFPIVVGTALTEKKPHLQVVVRPERVARVLGYDPGIKEMIKVCERLQFPVTLAQDRLIVAVPSRRQDIQIEEDLIEEFARLLGYDRIPATMMEGSLASGHLTARQRIKRALRDHLIACGLQEVWTYSFVSQGDAAKIRLTDAHPLYHMAELLNPLSEERHALRTTMLLSLLEVARFNTNRRIEDIRIFEMGTVFLPHRLPVAEQPSEVQQLAGILTGKASPSTPHGNIRQIDFFDVKGILEDILQKVGASGEILFTRSVEPFYHGGQCADISVDGLKIGSLGRLHASVAEAYDLPETYYFELEFDAVCSLAKEILFVEELPRYPSLERDLAFVVRGALPARELLATVRESAGEHLENVSVFDVYTGEHVAAEDKSIALHLSFRSTERTLTDDDIKDVMEAVVRKAKEQHGALLRA